MTLEHTVPENPVPAIPEGSVLRFFWHSSVAHIVFPNEPLPPGLDDTRRPAACGIRPSWPGVWFSDEEDYAFTSSDYGEKRAANLPICGNCVWILSRRGTEGERPA